MGAGVARFLPPYLFFQGLCTVGKNAAVLLTCWSTLYPRGLVTFWQAASSWVFLGYLRETLKRTGKLPCYFLSLQSNSFIQFSPYWVPQGTNLYAAGHSLLQDFHPSWCILCGCALSRGSAFGPALLMPQWQFSNPGPCEKRDLLHDS